MCKDCWDVGKWTEYRGGAKGQTVYCTCKEGQS
jgi:tricorn protease-like protein